LSSTSTADEAEISNAFSVPLPPQDKSSPPPSAYVQASLSEVQESDDEYPTAIYGPPPSQPPQQSKKRKLSDASTSSTSSTLSILPPLPPEEQNAREAALDARFSKRLRVARQDGVNEGWVPSDWKARVVMADRIKDMRRTRKRTRDDLEKDVGDTGPRTVVDATLTSTKPNPQLTRRKGA
jgi:hypothetical protein